MPKGYTTIEPGVQRSPEDRYWVRASVRHPRTGRMLSRSATLPAGATLHEARSRLAMLRLAIEEKFANGDGIPGRHRRRTLADCAERWTEAQAARVRRGTADHYARVLAAHVLPADIGPDGALFGELFADTINRSDVDRWCRWAEGRTQPNGSLYAKETVSGWWRVLCAFLRDIAADMGRPDPINRVKPPRLGGRPKIREQQTLSLEALADLVEAVRIVAPNRHAEVYVLAYTGLRPGELYALEWGDLNPDAGVIHVRRAHHRGWLDSTKTDDPRDVALTDGLHHVLHVHQQRAPKIDDGTVALPPALMARLVEADRITNADVRRTLGYSDSKARKALRRWCKAGLLVRKGARTRPIYKFGTGRAAVDAVPRAPRRPLVFPSRVGGFREPSSLHDPMNLAAEHAGITQRVGPQVLRRTFNTLMLRAGVDRVVLRAQMGHCSEEMTERYAGVSAEAKLEAVARIEAVAR